MAKIFFHLEWRSIASAEFWLKVAETTCWDLENIQTIFGLEKMNESYLFFMMTLTYHSVWFLFFCLLHFRGTICVLRWSLLLSMRVFLFLGGVGAGGGGGAGGDIGVRLPAQLRALGLAPAGGTRTRVWSGNGSRLLDCRLSLPDWRQLSVTGRPAPCRWRQPNYKWRPRTTASRGWRWKTRGVVFCHSSRRGTRSIHYFIIKFVWRTLQSHNAHLNILPATSLHYVSAATHTNPCADNVGVCLEGFAFARSQSIAA